MKKPDNLNARLVTGIVLALVLILGYFPFDAIITKALLILLAAFPAIQELLATIHILSPREFKQLLFEISSGKAFQSPSRPTYLLLETTMIILAGSVCAATFVDHTLIGATIIAAFGYDISAYFIGKNFGKKIIKVKKGPFPVTSKNKTWEGLISGILVSVTLCQLFFSIMQQHDTLFLSLGLTAFAILGDYLNSRLKRQAGIDDSGIGYTAKILPGHGGILDRFMSYFTSAAFAFCFSILTSRFLLL